MNGLSSSPNSITHKQKTTPARLLWRGTLIADSGLKLHGVAFIAHPKAAVEPNTQTSTTITTQTSPEAALTHNSARVPNGRPSLFRSLSSQNANESGPTVLNPPDNPFAPIRNRENPFITSNPIKRTPQQDDADLCLGLEVMRHRDLHIQSTVELATRPKPPEQFANRKRKRGSNKALKTKVEMLQKGRSAICDLAECQTIDVRMYLDSRCSTTVGWFSKKFCEGEVRRHSKCKKDACHSCNSVECRAPLTFWPIVHLGRYFGYAHGLCSHEDYLLNPLTQTTLQHYSSTVLCFPVQIPSSSVLVDVKFLINHHNRDPTTLCLEVSALKLLTLINRFDLKKPTVKSLSVHAKIAST